MLTEKQADDLMTAALVLVTSVSRDNRTTGTRYAVLIPRHRLRDLIVAIEAARPGLLDRIDQRNREAGL